MATGTIIASANEKWMFKVVRQILSRHFLSLSFKVSFCQNLKYHISAIRDLRYLSFYHRDKKKVPIKAVPVRIDIIIAHFVLNYFVAGCKH